MWNGRRELLTRDGQRTRGARNSSHRLIPGAHVREAFSVEDSRVRSTSKRPQLAVYARSFGVDGVGDLQNQSLPQNIQEHRTHPLPSSHLIGIPDPGNVIIPSRVWRDECGFRDEQSARDRRALVVVGYPKIAVNVRLVCTVASERCKNHTVTEPMLADLDGLEELWNDGCRHRG